MTEEELSFRAASESGRQAALQDVLSLVMRRAGEAFARGKDADAAALRKLAVEDIARLEQTASKRLKEYTTLSKIRESYS